MKIITDEVLTSRRKLTRNFCEPLAIYFLRAQWVAMLRVRAVWLYLDREQAVKIEQCGPLKQAGISLQEAADTKKSKTGRSNTGEKSTGKNGVSTCCPEECSSGMKSTTTVHGQKISAALRLVKSSVSGQGSSTIEGSGSEQELGAAIILKRLTCKDSGLAKCFQEQFASALEKIEKRSLSDGIFRATRRTLRQMVRNEESLSSEFAGRLRRFAFGKAQLDCDRSTLSGSEGVCSRSENGVSLVDALEKIAMNTRLTPDEYKEFQKAMGKKLQMKTTSVSGSEGDCVAGELK